MTPDLPAFTHGSNMPSEADPELLAEAGQPGSRDAYISIIRAALAPRRLYPVTITHWVSAYTREQAEGNARHCTKGGFGARHEFTVDHVGEPRER